MYSWKNEFGDEFAGRKVLVTGSTGFIGSHLCDALLSLSATVCGICRSSRPSDSTLPYEVFPLDLCEKTPLRAAVARMRPDYVFHLGGLVTARPEAELVLPMLHVNLTGTVNLLLASLDIQCRRFVAVGSSEEPLPGHPVPTSPYAAAKAAASMYARMFFQLYGLPTVVAKACLTFGPRQDRTKLIPHVISSFLSGKEVRIRSGSRECDFIYVSDTVRGLLRAAMQPGVEGEIIDIGTGKFHRIRDVVDMLAAMCNGTSRVSYDDNGDRPGETCAVESQCARRLFGWEPLWSLRDGLRETVNWHLTEGRAA